MNIPGGLEKPSCGNRAELRLRFVIMAAVVGFAAGLWEACLLHFVPSIRVFLRVDSTYVIWFLAPLADMSAFALLGVVLGCVAVAGGKPSSRRNIMLAAALLGAMGALIGWSVHFVHTHSVNLQVYSSVKDIFFPCIRFAAVFVLALLLAKVWRSQALQLFERPWPLRKLVRALVSVFVVLVAGVMFYAEAPKLEISRVAASDHQSSQSPNIVLIVMDTVRADHLSAYGYPRKTTPNIDRFASQGVLFENAIAAASWTLPSFASIFTGLLPHQHGANAFRPTNQGWVSLGEVLNANGYTTTGFNANCYYGESGWGLADGFEAYDDDPTSIRYNLARTLLGRVIVQPAYQNLDRYDAFFRRDAAALNQGVLRWLRHDSSHPFFLFINYFDAHSPYFAPPPYKNRFGEIPGALTRRVGFAGGYRPSKPLPASEQADLITGYDDSIAFIDSQIGNLLHSLQASPEWANTIVIITADHGEAFGEHGVYQHGNDLHREEIHVPLVIAGPGIPAGARITSPVPLRGLYPTILDLALGGKVPFRQYSLARLWEHNSGSAPTFQRVVSELSSSLDDAGVGEISLTTSEWHYIRTERGRQELYSWVTDPQEKTDLSSRPENQRVLEDLDSQLQRVTSQSLEPWLGMEYLSGLGKSAKVARHANAGDQINTERPEGVGAAQAYFHPDVPMLSHQPDEQQEELLKTLPYH